MQRSPLKYFSLLICILTLLTALTGSAFAAEEPETPPTISDSAFSSSAEPEALPAEPPADGILADSGDLSDTVHWTLGSDGTLTIYGSGAIPDYTATAYGIPAPPWRTLPGNALHPTAVVIEEGITKIGNYAFIQFTSSGSTYSSTIRSFSIPSSVTSIGEGAFKNCNLITSISLSANVTKIGTDAFAGCTKLKEITAPFWYDFTDCRVTTVTIPEGQAKIKDAAFKDCSYITSVSVPDSVTSIGENAFSYCSKLSSIRLSAKVSSIGDSAFQSCAFTSAGPLGGGYDYEFGWTESIPANAFSLCNKLSTICIPATVTSVGEDCFTGCICQSAGPLGGGYDFEFGWVETFPANAFSGCTSLKSIVFPEGLKRIGEAAFNYTALTSVIVPDSVTQIDAKAFIRCKQLTKATLPAGLSQISNELFYECDKLSAVNIPQGVTSIGQYAFFYCPKLAAISIPEGVASIGPHAFYKCALESIRLPAVLTSLGDNAFSGCTSLTEVVSPMWKNFSNCPATQVTVPGGVKALPTAAFSGCSQLTAIVLSEGLEQIPAQVFSGCTGLKKLTIPGSVTSMGANVFSGCTFQSAGPLGSGCAIEFGWTKALPANAFSGGSALWKIMIPATIETIGASAFSGCTMLFTAGPMDDGNFYSYQYGWTEAIPANAFSGCTKLEEVSFPAGLQRIGDNAFSGCSSLTEAVLPESVTELGNRAFFRCAALERVILPEGLSRIPADCFYSCTSLPGITLPESVTEIGDDAFYWCTSLTDLSLPAGLTRIGDKSFCWCTALSRITVPDGVCSIGEQAFYKCDKLEKIILPSSVTSMGTQVLMSCPLLNSAGPLGSGCPIEFGWTETIPANAFYDCRYLKTVSVPSGVSAIGDKAFFNCLALEEIQLPESLQQLGAKVFYLCGKLNYLSLPEGLQSIGPEAFISCTGLTEIALPDSVATLGDGAFSSCTSLTTIRLPASISRIGSQCFYNCKNLQEIRIPEGVTAIGGSAFYYCSSLNSVSLPAGLTSLGNDAFRGCSSLTDVYYLGLQSEWNQIAIGSNNEMLTQASFHCKRCIVFDANGGKGAPEALSWFWYDTPALPSTIPTRDRNQVIFTVTLDANGGNVEPTSLAIQQATIYSFVGWNTAADGSGTDYAPGADYTEDVDTTLYAQWNAATNTDGVELPSPTRTSYRFQGWASSNDATGGITGIYFPMGDVTLYATWSVILYTRTLTLPAELTQIESEAFADLTTGVNIEIPDSVVSIAPDAFHNSSVVILASEDSYALQWAKVNSVPWSVVED